MSLVIFDLDETLLAGDSCTLFCEFLVAEGITPPNFLLQNALMMERYDAQTLVLNDYVSFLIAPLQHLYITDIDALMPRFIEHYIAPRIYPEALQLVAEYLQKGIRPLIISATVEFIVKAIAEKIGVSDVLAIELKIQDNCYTGQVAGIPTFQKGKVTRLNRWLAEQRESIDGAFFYSDSINDLPLLELVEQPIATNPDDQLRVTAIQRNWPVLKWTRPDINEAILIHNQPLSQ